MRGVSGLRPDYGVDAPGLVRGFLLGGLLALGLAVAAWRFSPPLGAPWPWLFTGICAVAAAYLLGMFGLMVFWSKVTKVRGRERLLDAVAWRGDEAVLDVGCGRGLMLVGAARRLSSGKAIGIDIWQAADQSANAASGALDNAAREGVADRVEVQTADMRSLPFADDRFDVVLSHWAVHNLPDAADRDRALAEMARVLRPGGTVILADIEHRAAYVSALATLGLGDQQVLASPAADAILGAVSFGSFRPGAIVARAGV